MEKVIQYMSSFLIFICMLACSDTVEGGNTDREDIGGKGFVHANGMYIVDGDNQELILKGVGLGGWMLQEGYMLGTWGPQYKIRQKLEASAGKQAVDEFYEKWLDTFVTEEDVRLIAECGFNSIRLPMHYELYFNEDGSWGGNQTKGMKLTDALISWCRKYNLYVVLDLHAAPGGQGNHQDICDRRDGESMWEDSKYQDMAVEFWIKIAEKYKDEKLIAGYDLLNETNYTFPTGNNQPLTDFFKRLIDAVRDIDRNHLLIIEGNNFGGDYKGMDELAHYDPQKNLAVSFHAYWGKNTDAALSYYLELRNSWKVPLWRGEIGENSNTWFTEMVKHMDKHKIGWANWPWKKYGSHDGPVEIVKASKWGTVASYLSGKTPMPDAQFMKEALKEMIEAIRLKNCFVMKDVPYAWVGLPDGKGSKPYAEHNIPGTVFVSDYDLGELNGSWYDTGYQNTSGNPSEQDGNMGMTYRNDGVDIWKSNDDSELSNGYFIGEIADGEWTIYTLKSAKSGKYTVKLRYRSQKGGKIRLEADGKLLLEKELYGTNNGWSTAVLGTAEVPACKALKIVSVRGGYDMSSVTFE